MGRNILLRESNQPKIARHVDIGLGGVQRDQFGSLTNAKRRSVNACRLPPDVVDRSEPIEQQLTDDNGLLAAIPPGRSSDSVARRFAAASPTPGWLLAASRSASFIENSAACECPTANTTPNIVKYRDFIKFQPCKDRSPSVQTQIFAMRLFCVKE